MDHKEELATFYVKVDYVAVTLISILSALGIIVVFFLPIVVQYVEYTTLGRCYTDMSYYLLEAPLLYFIIIFAVLLFWSMCCRYNLKNSSKEKNEATSTNSEIS